MARLPLQVRRTRSPKAAVLLKGILGRKNATPVRTGRRAGASVSDQPPWLAPRADWRGTLPEWAIYWAHLALGMKEDQDFAYIYQFDLAPNGVDFFEFDIQMAIEIQGMYWHYGFGAAQQTNDLERRVRIEAFGIQMIFIDEDDALANPLYYLREARAGRDHSLTARGGA